MRIDSFVYTQEGLREAYDHLKEGGLMSVSFALTNSLMGKKIYHMLSAFPNTGHPDRGSSPVMTTARYDDDFYGREERR